MLGLGETDAEIYDTLGDLREYGVKILTVGQYLRPPPDHLAIQKLYTRRSSSGFASMAASLAFGMSSPGSWCVARTTRTRACTRWLRKAPPNRPGRCLPSLATNAAVLTPIEYLSRSRRAHHKLFSLPTRPVGAEVRQRLRETLETEKERSAPIGQEGTPADSSSAARLTDRTRGFAAEE